MQHEIPYGTLARFLSVERLGKYLQMAQGRPDEAARLYMENLNQCQLLYAKLHWLEIGLRNAVNHQLVQKYGDMWFDNPHVGLGIKEQQQIDKARKCLARDKKPLTNGNMVAEISFGLWVNLFNFPYEVLWRFPLRQAFAGHAGALQRHEISKKLHPVLKLRNRIAHYEPILVLDLKQLQQDIGTLIGWLAPEMKGRL